MENNEINKLLIAKDDVDLKLLDSVEEHSVMLDVISEKLDENNQDIATLKDDITSEIALLRDSLDNLDIEVIL